jgi:diguanylate cyclase (GGDEF)-like protein/PAS domain S-box-containing protein
MGEPAPTSTERTQAAYGGTDYVRLQQELIAVRTRLDRQIAQLTRLNHIANTLLSQQLGELNLDPFAETIPDVLDMAIGVVWELEAGQVVRLAACGLEMDPSLWLAIGTDLLALVGPSKRPKAIRLLPDALERLGDHNLCDLLLCPCISVEGECIGLALAANTITLAGMFDPISDETLAVLSQVAERLAAHLYSRRAHNLLETQLQRLQESEERLQRVLRGTNDGWWDWDLRTDQCLLSSRWVAMLGGDGDQARQQQGFWLDRVHPSEQDRFSHSLRQLLDGSSASTLELEVDLQRDDGSYLPVLVRGTASRDVDGRATRFSGTILDLTERKRHEAAVHRLAFYDALTELPNRRGLMDELPSAIRLCRSSGERLALLMIDLDSFKKLNDTYGHAAGDQLLQLVGQRLRQGVRGDDLVARLGGDEFVVVLNHIDISPEAGQATALRVAQGLLDRLARPYELEMGLITHHSASIGVALLDERSSTGEMLMQHADVALYDAKGAGRALVRLFDPDMQLMVSQRARLERQLRGAMQQQQLRLHYQAIVDAQGRLRSAEALMRWPIKGSAGVPPEQFIPVAEESGLIHNLGDWSLQAIAELLQRWGPQLDPDFRIALNLSASQFLRPDFAERMLDRLAVLGIPGQRLRLEITEATVLDDLGKAAERMNRLREHALEFSMDDFGTGYSSLSYLRALPFSEVKIDKSYVGQFLINRHDTAILRAVLSLCASLDMRLVAEGIETEQQWRALSAEGCDRFQGFLFSNPSPAGSDPSGLVHSRWRSSVQKPMPSACGDPGG